MNPIDRRLNLDVAAARYLEALEQDSFAVMEELWRAAMADQELEGVLHEIHAGLLEEEQLEESAALEDTVTAVVETHLPSAEIIASACSSVTVADVAGELFRRTPNRLPAGAHQLNERLLKEKEPLPEDLGLSALTAWAESLFGPAPAEYWQAFRQAAVKLELRRAADAEYRLAARRAGKREGKP
jgi:hypothetical protein